MSKPSKGSVRSLQPGKKNIIGRFPSETGRNRSIYRKRILVGVTVYSVFLACQASELDFEFDQLDDVILGIDPVFPFCEISRQVHSLHRHKGDL